MSAVFSLGGALTAFDLIVKKKRCWFIKCSPPGSGHWAQELMRIVLTSAIHSSPPKKKKYARILIYSTNIPNLIFFAPCARDLHVSYHMQSLLAADCVRNDSKFSGDYVDSEMGTTIYVSVPERRRIPFLFNFHLSFRTPAPRLAFWHILLFIHHFLCHNLNCHINLSAQVKKKLPETKMERSFRCTHVTLVVRSGISARHVHSSLASGEKMDRIDGRASTALAISFLRSPLFVLCVLECHQMQPVHEPIVRPFIRFCNSTLRGMWIIVTFDTSRVANYVSWFWRKPPRIVKAYFIRS